MKTALLRYTTKRGGSGMGYVSTEGIEQFVKKQFKNRIYSSVEVDGYIVGEVCKNPDGKWTWYFESEYCSK